MSMGHVFKLRSIFKYGRIGATALQSPYSKFVQSTRICWLISNVVTEDNVRFYTSLYVFK